MSMHKGMCGRSIGVASTKPEQTLGEYIARKQEQYREKLTFDEWFEDRCGGDTYTQQEDIKSRMRWAWNAAQDNKE